MTSSEAQDRVVGVRGLFCIGEEGRVGGRQTSCFPNPKRRWGSLPQTFPVTP